MRVGETAAAAVGGGSDDDANKEQGAGISNDLYVQTSNSPVFGQAGARERAARHVRKDNAGAALRIGRRIKRPEVLDRQK